MPAPAYRVLLSDYTVRDIAGELPFLFKQAGCRVEVFCPRGSWLLKNRFWDAWHRADVSSPERYADGLSALVRSTKYDWVALIDETAICAANDFITDDALAAQVLPIGTLEHRAMLGSKAGFTLLCQKYGLPMPPSRVAENDADALAAARAIGFPVMLKAEWGAGGSGVRFCPDEDAFAAGLASLRPNQKGRVTVQRYLPGTDVTAETLYQDGRLVAYAAASVHGRSDEFTPSVVRQYGTDETLERIVKRTGEALQLDGLAHLSLRKVGDEYFLYEADTRPNVWFRLDRFAGVDFSEGIRRYLAREEREPLGPTSEPEMRHFQREVLAALQNGDLATLRDWLVNKDGRWRFMPREPRLFIATIRLLPRPVAEAWLKRFPRVRALKRRVFNRA